MYKLIYSEKLCLFNTFNIIRFRVNHVFAFGAKSCVEVPIVSYLMY